MSISTVSPTRSAFSSQDKTHSSLLKSISHRMAGASSSYEGFLKNSVELVHIARVGISRRVNIFWKINSILGLRGNRRFTFFLRRGASRCRSVIVCIGSSRPFPCLCYSYTSQPSSGFYSCEYSVGTIVVTSRGRIDLVEIAHGGANLSMGKLHLAWAVCSTSTKSGELGRCFQFPW